MTKLIAIDLGTTLIKCTVFSICGEILATESIPCSLTYPDQQQVEQDAEIWYVGVCEAISRLVSKIGPNDIEGISVSSQGISVVPVDQHFQPLQHAISWLDMRADDACIRLLDYLPAQQWYARTGKFLSACYTLPKLLWLKTHKPDVFYRAKYFLLPMDYVHARMTGYAVTDHTMAAGTMAYNIQTTQWDREILNYIGLTSDSLAQILPSGSLIGTINAETIKRTGLHPTTKVYCGGQDQKVAAFGADIGSERCSLSLGTAGALEFFASDVTKQSFLPVFPHVIPQKTVLEGCVNTTGAAIQWFKDTLAPDCSFDELNQAAQTSQIGSNGIRFYPHLSRPGTPHTVRTEYGSIHGISLACTRGDLFRSLYEGLAYEFRLNLEVARKAGSNISELLLFGGASKSNVFCQIIADVTGKTVLQANCSEMSSIGAAKLAAMGLELDYNHFAKNAAGQHQCYTPNPTAVAQYTTLYLEYIQHYKSEE